MNKSKCFIKTTIQKTVQSFCRITNSHCKIDFPSSIKIQSPRFTLERCAEFMINRNRGAYLRFGDGDINLMEECGELLQSSDKNLAKEMREAFSLSGEGIVKSLPLHSHKFGIMPGMKPGIHGSSDEWCDAILQRCFQYFIGEKIYSSVALPYVAVFEYEYAVEFLTLLRSFNPIFVGNENIGAEVLEKLFGENVHIKTPDKQSYQQIDRIEQDTLRAIHARKRQFEIVVVAMGCSGRVLEKRIIKNTDLPVFLFDFGSLLDIFCGWNTRAWMDLAEVSEEYWSNMLKDISK